MPHAVLLDVTKRTDAHAGAPGKVLLPHPSAPTVFTQQRTERCWRLLHGMTPRLSRTLTPTPFRSAASDSAGFCRSNTTTRLSWWHHRRSHPLPCGSCFPAWLQSPSSPPPPARLTVPGASDHLLPGPQPAGDLRRRPSPQRKLESVHDAGEDRSLPRPRRGSFTTDASGKERPCNEANGCSRSRY
jgi:hypothetical protein